MNKELIEQNNFYWIVGLRSDARIHVHAHTSHALNGDLCFFNSDGDMMTSFAKGTWAFCTASSVIDGSMPLIEHWDKGKDV